MSLELEVKMEIKRTQKNPSLERTPNKNSQDPPSPNPELKVKEKIILQASKKTDLSRSRQLRTFQKTKASEEREGERQGSPIIQMKQKSVHQSRV